MELVASPTAHGALISFRLVQTILALSAFGKQSSLIYSPYVPLDTKFTEQLSAIVMCTLHTVTNRYADEFAFTN